MAYLGPGQLWTRWLRTSRREEERQVCVLSLHQQQGEMPGPLCPEPYTREEVLEECFGDLLKGLVFDDEVMDWASEALQQSHADEKRFRDEAIARLQAEHSKTQHRLDKLYEDRLDGFIEP